MVNFVFFVIGIGFVIWGVLGITNPDVNWRIFGESERAARRGPAVKPPDWARQSRQFGYFGIVIGVFNIFLVVIRWV